MIHLELYVEEPSAKAALDILVPAILDGEVSFAVHPFRGKQELLSDIGARLRGYAAWMPPEFRIVIVVDEDRQSCHELKRRLTREAETAGISDRVLSRIAVEELEAWFFGDVEALRAVYPRIPGSLAAKAGFRDPDAITGGTWEALDRLLRRHGYPAGLIKTEAAAAIARHMDPDANRSRSFQVFRDGLRRLVAAAEG